MRIRQQHKQSRFEPNVGDVCFIELGVLHDNTALTRLVKVVVEMVSYDGEMAIVRGLPHDPGKKDVIFAEKVAHTRMVAVKSNLLFRSEKHYKDSHEFQVGDIVAMAMQQDGGMQLVMGTVTKVAKISLTFVTADGQTVQTRIGNCIVASRKSDEVDPEDTEHV